MQIERYMALGQCFGFEMNS